MRWWPKRVLSLHLHFLDHFSEPLKLLSRSKLLQKSNYSNDVNFTRPEAYLDSFQNIPFGFCVSSVFLITNDSSLVEDLHGKKGAGVFARAFSYLKHLAIAAFAQHSSQFKIIWTGFTAWAMGVVFRYGYSFCIICPVMRSNSIQYEKKEWIWRTERIEYTIA